MILIVFAEKIAFFENVETLIEILEVNFDFFEKYFGGETFDLSYVLSILNKIFNIGTPRNCFLRLF